MRKPKSMLVVAKQVDPYEFAVIYNLQIEEDESFIKIQCDQVTFIWEAWSHLFWGYTVAAGMEFLDELRG